MPPGHILYHFTKHTQMRAHTRRHTHAYTQPNQENSIIALKQEHSDAALQSLAEVTMSRKPIKKMINIHVGEASLTCRWDWHTIHSPTHTHTHTSLYNGCSEYCSPASCSCSVLGGGDQEVNMILASSFIRLMKVITAYREGRAARLTKTI